AISRQVTGHLGRMLCTSGISAALVGPDGAIRAVNAAFARRASGDEHASLVGQDFAGLLVSDDRDRIYFAREGKKGSSQTLVHVPLGGPDDVVVPGTTADDEPALMLLLDAGIGLGGLSTEARGQTPQLEALLEKLPLGLAMTDRDGHFLFANPAFLRAAGLE